jgi:hypothetical protein
VITPLMVARRKRCALTHDELAYIRTHYATTPTADLATYLGVSTLVVSNRARLMGLRKTDEYLSSRGRKDYRKRIDD